jgi:hypothetical protein
MNLKLDPILRAGDVARDLAAIGYVIKPDGTLTTRQPTHPSANQSTDKPKEATQ